MMYHKGCWMVPTAGRWPWKLEAAKECVIVNTQVRTLKAELTMGQAVLSNPKSWDRDGVPDTVRPRALFSNM